MDGEYALDDSRLRGFNERHVFPDVPEKGSSTGVSGSAVTATHKRRRGRVGRCRSVVLTRKPFQEVGFPDD